ncbi:phosphoribosylanthranilate isomerase [Luteimonas aestuarii]|uniref:N-(5'-phosphoribosyl)anthranilate isomerase n=1 Tax=Luteimonas aestuarii TaxID=453837 RepID=A0A4R5U479_9GAMM|nr:phosphoribosylanthranilate isomerase [Luteimonas aestuarii]TDK28449.1 phosphoribosylanthranilate isomerase [Luteimonas aestuarii]
MSRPLYRTRVKFCGLTRPGDVRLAGELGVDAVGFVFAPASRRRVEIDAAAAMTHALAPLVDSVALFMDNAADEVREVVRQVKPALLQFHGNEDDAFCRSFGVAYIKAVPMGGGDALDPLSLHSRYPAASAFLLDGHAPGAAGGEGHLFDWASVPKGMTKPFLLAGGLTPDNVFDAVVATLPWGVDVSSGIEVEGDPGVKDGARMRRFVEEVRRADCD